MALVSPFINSIRAFDVAIGTTINLSVLGGDAITKYRFSLYNNDGSNAPFYTSGWFNVENDIPSKSIRNFPIVLNSVIDGLTNNESYKIEPIIANEEYPNGLVGQQTLFQCYAAPNISLQYKILKEGIATYSDVLSGVVFNSSMVDFRFSVNLNVSNNQIKPNSITTALYGINHNGNKSIVTKPKVSYNFSNIAGSNISFIDFSLDGFSVNVNSNGDKLSAQSSQYKFFEIEVIFETVDGMQVPLNISNLNCFYSIVDNPSVFDVLNVCEKGIVQLRYSLTSLEATSNPDQPTFIGGQEVDLREDDSWAQWQRYFTLTQPFTLRLWARDLQEGDIMVLSSTSASGNYIKIKYNIEETNGVQESFISLECGQADISGNSMFPYYIESQRILTNTIIETTNLFIGIQREDNLFNLDFQVL